MPALKDSFFFLRFLVTCLFLFCSFFLSLLSLYVSSVATRTPRRLTYLGGGWPTLAAAVALRLYCLHQAVQQQERKRREGLVRKLSKCSGLGFGQCVRSRSKARKVRLFVFSRQVTRMHIHIMVRLLSNSTARSSKASADMQQSSPVRVMKENLDVYCPRLRRLQSMWKRGCVPHFVLWNSMYIYVRPRISYFPATTYQGFFFLWSSFLISSTLIHLV